MKKIYGLLILGMVCLISTKVDAQTATNKIDSTGNVGVGTLAPLGLLHINAPTGHFANDGTNSTLKLSYTNTVYANHYIGTAWNYFIDNPYSGTSTGGIHFKTAGSDRMSITKGGNVGIGTTSPSAKLHVNGNVNIESSIFRRWLPTETDINDLIGGSTTGTLLESYPNAHFTIGLRSNDNSDGFQIISSTNTTPWSNDPYGELVFEVKRTGATKIYNSLSTTGTIGNLNTSTDVGQQLEVGTSGLSTLRFDSDAWRVYSGGAGANGELFRIQESGNVGIGTAAPQDKLAVDGNVSLGSGDSDGSKHLVYRSRNDQGLFEENYGLQLMAPENIIIGLDANNNNSNTKFAIIKDTSTLYGVASDALPSSTLFLVEEGGNVGIGTINPSHMLTVAGTVKTREIIVEETADADFVFETDYDLPTLANIEAFIKANKHLEGIPSAEEMKANGVKVGELQIKLLQKIEELTLYMIEQDKKDKEKDSIIKQLLEANKDLAKRIEQLEKRGN